MNILLFAALIVAASIPAFLPTLIYLAMGWI